jgi:carbon monoxide dehydrogenase subunit G
VKLTDTFTIPANHDRSWELLQDIPAVARCLPGAQLSSLDDESCTGAVKVKIGPIVLTYHGQLDFIDRNPAEGVMTMRANGKDKRGAGTVSGVLKLVETESTETETTFSLEADIDITGKPAQFGRNAIQDVSSRLIGQFAQNLATLVDVDDVPSSQGSAPSSTSNDTSPNLGTGALGVARPQINSEPFDLLSGSRRMTTALVVGGAAALVAAVTWAWVRRASSRTIS